MDDLDDTRDIALLAFGKVIEADLHFLAPSGSRAFRLLNYAQPGVDTQLKQVSTFAETAYFAERAARANAPQLRQSRPEGRSEHRRPAERGFCENRSLFAGHVVRGSSSSVPPRSWRA
jgi:hypothetical protein